LTDKFKLKRLNDGDFTTLSLLQISLNYFYNYEASSYFLIKFDSGVFIKYMLLLGKWMHFSPNGPGE